METYEINFSITSKQGGQSYLALLWHRDGVYIISSLVIIALCISGLSDTHYRPLATFGLGVTSVFWYGWLYGLHRAKACFANPTCSQVSLRISNEFITFATAESTSSIQWSGFSRIYCMKKFWILQRRSNQNYSSIPTVALSLESSAFLLRMIKEAGVSIR
jgi:hypothetical protein